MPILKNDLNMLYEEKLWKINTTYSLGNITSISGSKNTQHRVERQQEPALSQSPLA